MTVETADTEGLSWLAASERERKRLIWTGHGASFALAQIFAAALEERGWPSRALPLSQCGGETICLVSQSARDPGVPVALLVTEAARAATWTSSPRLEVPRRGPPEWLPLSFMREALRVFGHALGAPPWPATRVPPHEPRNEILVVERYAEPLRTLVSAARHKLEGLPLESVACEELGHGLHARLWRQPDAHRVRWLCHAEGPHEPDQNEAVHQWCEQAGIAFVEQRVSTSTDEGTGLRPLMMFDQVIALIEALCLAHGIDWRECQVPAEADWLRDVRRNPR